MNPQDIQFKILMVIFITLFVSVASLSFYYARKRARARKLAYEQLAKAITETKITEEGARVALNTMALIAIGIVGIGIAWYFLKRRR